MDKSFTRNLAEFVAHVQYEDLNNHIVSKVKTCIFDALACSCGGYDLPWSQAARKFAVDQGGNKNEATVWIDGSKTNYRYAAFANTVMSHSIIHEDMHAESQSHLGTIVIPSALALGEKLGSSGKELITAIVAGYESMARIGKAITTEEFTKRGFRPSGNFGTFGSLTVGAKLLGLVENKMVNGFGLAGNLSSGVQEWANAGTGDIYFQNGFATINGLSAAVLAQNDGVTAPEWVVEGKSGLANAWAGSQEKVHYALAGLGKSYEIEKVYHKPAPGCAFTQESIQGALQLVKQHNIVPEDVDQVVISAYPMVKLYPGCDYSGPFSSLIQAQMSNQFAVASVLVNKDVQIRYYLDYANPRVYELAKKIKVEIDPEAEAVYPREKCSKVVVRMKNGTVYSFGQKDLKNLSPEEVFQKFKLLAVDKFGAERLDQISAVVNDFEKMNNISELTKLLSK